VTQPDLTFVYIVEPPDYQIMACTLLASIRSHFDAARVAAIGYCPAHRMDELHPAVLKAHRMMGAEIRPMVTEGMWDTPYPHGNKILACRAPRSEAATVFLDTDMVCCAPLDLVRELRPGAVSVIPEGTPTWGKNNDRWDRAYAHFGLPLPTARVRLTRKRRREFYPYFNAGFIGFDTECPADFAEEWYRTAHDLDWNCKVALKRPWLDQITLPIAMARAGIDYHVLPDTLNFSVSDRAHEPDKSPRLIHYHSFRYAREWPQVRAEMDRLAQIFPAPLMARLRGEFQQFWTPAPDAA